MSVFLIQTSKSETNKWMGKVNLIASKTYLRLKEQQLLMKFYGIEITVDELSTIFNKISNYINKDKNTLCLVLELANLNVQEWYNEINDKFSPLIGTGIKTELPKTPEDLSKCVHNNDRKITADRLASFLDDARKRSESHARSMTDIFSSLEEFKATREQKSYWLDAAVETKVWNVDSRQVNDWINDLESIEEQINKSIVSLQNSIGCNPISNEQLFKDYRK
jgi:methyl-accepting chemotaxis protein